MTEHRTPADYLPDRLGVTAERLGATRSLAGLPHDTLEALTGVATAITAEPLTLLAREGQAADAFFVIEHGRVAIELHAPGRGEHVIATIGPGQLVGWSWRFPPHVWHFDVMTLDPVSAFRFDAPGIRQLCEHDPLLGHALTERIAATMARRLEATRLQLLDMYGSPS